MCHRRADVRASADAGLKPASSRRSYASSGDDREWFDRLLRSVKPGQCNALVNAFSAQRMILKMMRRERHRGSQLNRHADEPLSVVVHQSAMFGGGALDAVPWGAGRMRAPLAVPANGGSAMRHRRDDVNIRLRDSLVNPLRVIGRLPTIA